MRISLRQKARSCKSLHVSHVCFYSVETVFKATHRGVKVSIQESLLGRFREERLTGPIYISVSYAPAPRENIFWVVEYNWLRQTRLRLPLATRSLRSQNLLLPNPRQRRFCNKRTRFKISWWYCWQPEAVESFLWVEVDTANKDWHLVSQPHLDIDLIAW